MAQIPPRRIDATKGGKSQNRAKQREHPSLTSATPAARTRPFRCLESSQISILSASQTPIPSTELDTVDGFLGPQKPNPQKRSYLTVKENTIFLRLCYEYDSVYEKGQKREFYNLVTSGFQKQTGKSFSDAEHRVNRLRVEQAAADQVRERMMFGLKEKRKLSTIDLAGLTSKEGALPSVTAPEIEEDWASIRSKKRRRQETSSQEPDPLVQITSRLAENVIHKQSNEATDEVVQRLDRMLETVDRQTIMWEAKMDAIYAQLLQYQR